MVPLIHWCGYVPQWVHFSKETNPGGAIQFDYQVDLAWVKELLRGEVTIMGNLNYNKLTVTDPKQVSDHIAKRLKIAATGGGFWLAFGCEIPRELPVDNMKAIMRELKRSGKYPIS